MPHTFAQWMWFAFFAVGAIGGWIFVIRAALKKVEWKWRLF